MHGTRERLTWNRSLTPKALWNKRSVVDLRHWCWIPIGSLEMFANTFHKLRTEVQYRLQNIRSDHYERLGAKLAIAWTGPWKVVKHGSAGEMSMWWSVQQVGDSSGKQEKSSDSIWSVFREVYRYQWIVEIEIFVKLPEREMSQEILWISVLRYNHQNRRHHRS